MVRLIAGIVAMMATGGVSGADIVGAAADDHVWFATVEPGATGRVRLYHHATDMGGPYHRSPMTLVESPAAMAAAEDRAWLIFDPQPTDSTPRREVYSVHARRNLATGWYFYEPEGALAPHPSLPSHGSLAGAAALADGLAVLLMPRRRPGQEAADDLTRPQLLLLRGNKWVEEALPESVQDARLALLAARGPAASDDSLTIIAVVGGSGAADRSPRLIICTRRTDGTWREGQVVDGARSSDEPVGGAGVAGLGVPVFLASMQGQLVLGMLVGDGSPSRDDLRLGMIRSIGDREAPSNVAGEYLPFVTLAPPHMQRLIAGTRGGLIAIERRPNDAIVLREIDALLGTIGVPRPMSGQPLSAAGRVYLPLLLTALTVTMLVVILVRPMAPGECRLPEGARPADLLRRLAALGVDSFPCVAIALWTTRSGLDTLASFPLWAPVASEAWPLILAVSLVAVHSFASEALWSRTIGKALLGLRVVRVNGERPGIGRLFARNLLKAMVLLLPPLTILVLLNAYRQQLGDIVGGTLVVEDAPELRDPR